MDRYLLPYLLLMAHFVSGALWLIRINRKLEPAAARKQWIKYITYLIVVNLVWCCLVWFEGIFPVLGIILILIASAEWWLAIKKLTQKAWLILLFLMVLAGFWRFLYLDKTLLLFTWFVVVLFDGSCQIAGQLAGKRKLLPGISPRKTVEGLAGGAVVTLATSLLVRKNFSFEWTELILMTCLVMASAFLGDLLASSIKRRAGIVAYGKILPGHGGVLDRFDSLIMAGAVVYLIILIQTLTR